MNNKSFLIVALVAIAGGIFYMLNRSSSGKEATATFRYGNGQASAPSFFGFGGAPQRPAVVQASPGAAPWAQVASAGINTLGNLAARIWSPNRNVPTQTTSNRVDSPSDKVTGSQSAQSYSLTPDEEYLLDDEQWSAYAWGGDSALGSII